MGLYLAVKNKMRFLQSDISPAKFAKTEKSAKSAKKKLKSLPPPGGVGDHKPCTQPKIKCMVKICTTKLPSIQCVSNLSIKTSYPKAKPFCFLIFRVFLTEQYLIYLFVLDYFYCCYCSQKPTGNPPEIRGLF